MKKNNICWLTLIALPWLITSAILFFYSVDAPRLDDFEALLHWHQQYQSANTLPEKLSLLFSDYQNHRYALLRLPLLLTGQINFQLYAYLSPILLLILLLSLSVAVKFHPQRLPLLALASLCFCNLQLWPAAVWAPLGSANLLYVSTGLVSSVLIWRNYQICGWLLAGLLCITHGSGPLLLLALGIGKSFYSPKQWQHWLFIGVLLFGYFMVLPTTSGAGYSSIENTQLIQLISQHAVAWTSACLQIIGSVFMENAVNDQRYLMISSVVGGLIFAVFSVSYLKGHWRSTPAIIVWLLFLALVIASIAAGRALTIDSSQILQGHYKLLSNIGLWLGISSVFLLIVSKYQRLAVSVSLAIAAVMYVAGVYLSLPKLQATQAAYWQDSCQFITNHQQQLPAKLNHPASVLYVKQPNKKLKAAYDSGFYRPNCSAD